MMKIRDKSLLPRHFRIAWILLIAGFIISGCVSFSPYPREIKAGDTVTLAIGSADGADKNNTVMEFLPDPVNDPTNSIPITIRAIVKLKPGETSRAWLNDSTGIPRRSSHGPWLTLVVADTPTNLPVGTTGVFRITTSPDVAYPRYAATPNQQDFAVTVIAGTGSPDPLMYRDTDVTPPIAGNLAKVGDLFQVIVKPEVPAEGQAEAVRFGAIEMHMTIQIDDLDGGTVQDDGIAVVLDDQPQNILNQTHLIWKRNGNNFDIALISPKGMFGHEARVSIVPRWPDYLYGVVGTPTLDSITYYDLDGNLHPGPLPAFPTVANIANPNF